MYDLHIIGDQIVRELGQLIQEQIIVTNQQGMIKASTEPERVGSFHEGSLLSMRKKQILHMKQSEVEKLQGVRPGMVFPIIIQNEPIGVIGVTGDPKHISQYGMLVKRLAEMLISDFIHQRDHVQKEQFLAQLLQGMSEKEVRRGAKELKMDTAQLYRIVIVEDVLREWMHEHVKKELFTAIHQGQYAILLPANQELIFLYDWQQKVGIGGSYLLEQIKTSYEEAKTALLYCSKERPVVQEKELTMELIVADITRERAMKFVSRVCGSLVKDSMLFEHMYLRIMTDWTLNELASYLHIHRNTLNYRLMKIEEKLGYKLTDVKGRANLYMSCLLIEKFQLYDFVQMHK